jgi:hypothetical protein
MAFYFESSVCIYLGSADFSVDPDILKLWLAAPSLFYDHGINQPIWGVAIATAAARAA